jgi:hypothetical protein
MRPDFAAQWTARSDPADRHQLGAVMPAIDWRTLRTATRACCCPAKPAVVAVLPPAAGRGHPTDLLLCGHHYRASQLALLAADAAVFDAQGRTLIPPSRVLLGAGEAQHGSLHSVVDRGIFGAGGNLGGV